jgi:hypothetical protein
MLPWSHQTRHPSRRRHGGAMIEFAICLPLLVSVTLGTVEACRMIYLRQSIKIAAYECARLGIVPGAEFANLQDHCDVLLNGRRLKEFQLSCEPADLSVLDFSDPLIVKVDISVPANALLGSLFYAGTHASESVTIMAEF